MRSSIRIGLNSSGNSGTRPVMSTTLSSGVRTPIRWSSKLTRRIGCFSCRGRLGRWYAGGGGGSTGGPLCPSGICPQAARFLPSGMTEALSPALPRLRGREPERDSCLRRNDGIAPSARKPSPQPSPDFGGGSRMRPSGAALSAPWGLCGEGRHNPLAVILSAAKNLGETPCPEAANSSLRLFRMNGYAKVSTCGEGGEGEIFLDCRILADLPGIYS